MSPETCLCLLRYILVSHRLFTLFLYFIIKLSLFGSSIRDDFTQNSDVDILVSFDKNSKITLFDIIELENEFAKLLGRDVDIVEKESLKNPIRKEKILSSREIIYAA